MMASDSLAASAAAIEAGRTYYETKRYKLALEQFTLAMKHCPCSRGVKRDRCSCKDFEGVASQNGSIFTEAMYKCECHVGRTFNKCDKALHIRALDYRAATFEALQELDRARRDAEWILELAPRLLDGYLRLGKIARLQKNDEFAWKIYNAGIEVGLSNGYEKSSKLEQLYKVRQPLQVRFLKKDPIELPLEILQVIFSHLDLVTLVRCLRVCKVWQEALTGKGNQRLWRSLVFIRSKIPRRFPRADSLRKLLAFSGNDVRELIIEDGKQFFLSKEKFLIILNSAKRLERLELWSLLVPLELHTPVKSLTHLVLKGFADIGQVAEYQRSFHDFLMKSAENLQSLCLAGFPKAWRHGDAIPMMPQLRYFMLEGTEASTNFTTLPMLELLDRTPQLEQLVLDSPNINGRLYKERDPNKVFPVLKYLRIVERRMLRPLSIYDEFSSLTIDGYSAMSCLHNGKGLKALDITMNGNYGPQDLFFLDVILDQRRNKGVMYEDLESFRLSTLPIDPPKAKHVFGRSLLKGKLHTFDIVFPLDSLSDRVGDVSNEHLIGYDWLRGAESIRSLGLFSFSFSSLYRNEEDMPLLKFLMSFPNLEVLEIDSDRYEDAALSMLIRDILKVTRLKALHQYRVKGAMMDELQKLADQRGVSLVWGERSRSWPLKFGQ